MTRSAQHPQRVVAVGADDQGDDIVVPTSSVEESAAVLRALRSAIPFWEDFVTQSWDGAEWVDIHVDNPVFNEAVEEYGDFAAKVEALS